MEDLLIRGGQVIDGNGTPARRADVAIRNGRITAVGDCQDREAQREIDASGQIVAPGFIDIHTHSDFTLPLNPLAESKVRQGVTTEVVWATAATPLRLCCLARPRPFRTT
jgi:N-acyl-D-amino-acid deacylase